MSGPDGSNGWSIRHESEGFGVNPKVGCSSPSLVKTFSASKSLSQEHPFVSSKWMPVHSWLSNVVFRNKNIYDRLGQCSKTWNRKCPGSSNSRAFGMNPKVRGSSPPFARKSERGSKMNGVSCAQLTFQILTFPPKNSPRYYYYTPGHFENRR